MRLLIALLVIAYLVGVGYVLAPQLKQTGAPAPHRNSSRVLRRNFQQHWLGRQRHITALQ